ncbi:MAG: NHL repeat-containing protein, partial [Nitrospirota bacterium]
LSPFIWGGLGFTQGQLNQPTYLTMDENNVLWVSDTGNGRVEGFNVSESNPAVDATYYREFGNDITLPYGAGRLNHPTAIAYDNQGFGGFLVLDKLQDGSYAIEKFDREGRYTGVFTTSGDKEGQLKDPVDIAVNTFDNTCFVTDRGRRKVMVYNNKGEFIYEFGGDELADPRGIAVLRNGYVYVTDAAKNMVYRYVPQ